MTSARVLVIIPALNEQDAIAGVVREVRECLPDCDVLVIDDGSRDDTAARARAAGARVAVLPYNLGVGGAMRLGYRYAVSRGYDRAVQVDADGQHDPRFVPELLARVDEGADLVIGARFAGAGDYEVRGPRRWAMRLLSGVLSRVAGTQLTDTTSGFRATSRPMMTLFADAYPVEYLGDTVETLVLAARRGYTVRQVPVSMRVRTTGRPSHSPTKAAIYLGRAFLVLLLALIRN
ncbi:glycosyltransferase family 2 protein [Angustibacter sp. Root456]|uniref:glycosyltransferase family 2 protein n=1 Tax=Angustibacter sp. Root456 TaxID=1736539 RepID=UPI0006F3A63B|nr:glycosyltransferase family 2 protein [Angustibacter sp. Root456]KQX69929.1 glycosyl transferase family 2 [Angustibacter sp. Root456]